MLKISPIPFPSIFLIIESLTDGFRRRGLGSEEERHSLTLVPNVGSEKRDRKVFEILTSKSLHFDS